MVADYTCEPVWDDNDLGDTTPVGSSLCRPSLTKLQKEKIALSLGVLPHSFHLPEEGISVTGNLSPCYQRILRDLLINLNRHRRIFENCQNEYHQILKRAPFLLTVWRLGTKLAYYQEENIPIANSKVGIKMEKPG